MSSSITYPAGGGGGGGAAINQTECHTGGFHPGLCSPSFVAPPQNGDARVLVQQGVVAPQPRSHSRRRLGPTSSDCWALEPLAFQRNPFRTAAAHRHKTGLRSGVPHRRRAQEGVKRRGTPGHPHRCPPPPPPALRLRAHPYPQAPHPPSPQNTGLS